MQKYIGFGWFFVRLVTTLIAFRETGNRKRERKSGYFMGIDRFLRDNLITFIVGEGVGANPSEKLPHFAQNSDSWLDRKSASDSS